MRTFLTITLIAINFSACFGQEIDVCPIDNLRVVHDNPLSYIKETPGFASIFREWGFIGDSLSSREHEYIKEDGTKGYLDLYEYSWGQFMCASTRAKGVNFSKGGLTCRSWLNQLWDKAKEDPKQAYIIALGVNDRYKKYKVGNVETDIDTLDFNKMSKLSLCSHRTRKIRYNYN